MPNQTDRWEQTPRAPIARQPFQARNSTDSRHLDVEQRRNQDVEEAARDRLIFRWVLLLFSLLGVLGAMILIIKGVAGR